MLDVIWLISIVKICSDQGRSQKKIEEANFVTFKSDVICI